MNLNHLAMIKHRKMNLDDLLLIYNWRKEKKVIKNSLSKNKITIDEHRIWFNKVIKSENHVCLIFSLYGEDFGLVRFFLENSSAQINYLICEKFRGKKLSKTMLIQSIKFLLSKYKIKKIFATVLINNHISQKVLEAIDFKQLKIQKNYINYILKTK